MKDMDKINLIANIIYETIGYCDCDTCGTPETILDEDSDYPGEPAGDIWCEQCHRKYSNWRISHNAALKLAERIIRIE